MMRLLPIRIGTTSLAVIALAAAALSSNLVTADAAPLVHEEQQPVCSESADSWAWIGTSFPDIPMGDADDEEDCDVYREDVFRVAPNDGSDCQGAPATYSILANGIQAAVPQDCVGTVSVWVEGTNAPVDYALQGFRLVIPSEPTTPFAAQVQFVHKQANDTGRGPSSMVLALWISSSNESTISEPTDEEAAAWNAFLGGLVNDLEGLQASCNATESVLEAGDAAPTDLVGMEDTNPVEEEPPKIVPGAGRGDKADDAEGPKIVPPPPTGPAVVGRGDEQTFANDPIRRTLNTDVSWWYDLWGLASSSSSSSFYTYETQACNQTVQWNLKASPLVVSLDLEAFQTALEGSFGVDPTTCQPISWNATAANEPILQASRSATMISKVCPLSFAPVLTEESAGEAWTPLGLGIPGMLALIVWVMSRV